MGEWKAGDRIEIRPGGYGDRWLGARVDVIDAAGGHRVRGVYDDGVPWSASSVDDLNNANVFRRPSFAIERNVANAWKIGDKVEALVLVGVCDEEWWLGTIRQRRGDAWYVVALDEPRDGVERVTTSIVRAPTYWHHKPCGTNNEIGAVCASCGSPERGAALDAVRDEQTLPDPDVATGEEMARALAPHGLAHMHPSAFSWDAGPSPGPCPQCGTQRRERGEVRTHVWRCGCAVRPGTVDPVWIAGGFYVGEVSDYPEAEARERGFERGWCAESDFWAPSFYRAYHPTRDGAIAAWREALAEAQRREDEAARSTFAASPRWDEVHASPAQTIADVGRGAEVAACSVCSLPPHASRVGLACACGGDRERAVVGVATEDSRPDPERPGEHLVTVALGGLHAGVSSAASEIGAAIERAVSGPALVPLTHKPAPPSDPVLAGKLHTAVEREMTARLAEREAAAIATADLDALVAVANALAGRHPDRLDRELRALANTYAVKVGPFRFEADHRRGVAGCLVLHGRDGAIHAWSHHHDDSRSLVTRLARAESPS